jgi:dihydroorotase
MGMKFQIRNACWLGDDAWFHHGTISIANGRIMKLESDFASDTPSAGEFIVPGLIDAHVHLREPGQPYKEGIANGTLAALKGGVTTVLNMPNNVPPTASLARLEAKRALFAQKSRVNYGLFLQARIGGPRAPESAAGVKIYMAKSSALAAVRDPAALAQIFRLQNRVVVHAEDEREFSTGWKKSFHRVEKTGEIFHSVEKSFPQCGKLPHHLRRPRAAVVAALQSIATAWRRVPPKERPRLVIAHCSTVEEIDWVRKMKRQGHDVWAETCPHYFLFTEQDDRARGPALQVNPPLRTEEDRAAVFAAVQDGGIDFISTDHAPHLPKEKAADSPPSGIAGLEWFGPVLLTLTMRGEISWQRYLKLAGQKAAQCYGIEGRGLVREGAWADLAIVANKPPAAAQEKIVTRAAVHPYPQFEFAVGIRATLVNGRLAWTDGRVRPGVHGREVYG